MALVCLFHQNDSLFILGKIAYLKNAFGQKKKPMNLKLKALKIHPPGVLE